MSRILSNDQNLSNEQNFERNGKIVSEKPDPPRTHSTGTAAMPRSDTKYPSPLWSAVLSCVTTSLKKNDLMHTGNLLPPCCIAFSSVGKWICTVHMNRIFRHEQKSQQHLPLVWAMLKAEMLKSGQEWPKTSSVLSSQIISKHQTTCGLYKRAHA